MKKGHIALVIIAGILLVLGGFYWFGYIEFQDNIPTFTLTPGTTQSNATDDYEETPSLVIDSIKGKFNKVSATIKNIGDNDLASVTWSISVEGGILKRIDVRSSGTVALSRQSETTVVSDRIPFGLGRLEITVTVEGSPDEPMERTAQGFKLFFFVVGVHSY